MLGVEEEATVLIVIGNRGAHNTRKGFPGDLSLDILADSGNLLNILQARAARNLDAVFAALTHQLNRFSLIDGNGLVKEDGFDGGEIGANKGGVVGTVTRRYHNTVHLTDRLIGAIHNTDTKGLAEFFCRLTLNAVNTNDLNVPIFLAVADVREEGVGMRVFAAENYDLFHDGSPF